MTCSLFFTLDQTSLDISLDPAAPLTEIDDFYKFSTCNVTNSVLEWDDS